MRRAGRTASCTSRRATAPGLLTDIVKVLKDINVNVVSAEVGCSPWPPASAQPLAGSTPRPSCTALQCCPLRLRLSRVKDEETVK